MTEPRYVPGALPSIYSFKPDVDALAAVPGSTAYANLLDRLRMLISELPQIWVYATEDGNVWERRGDGPWEQIAGPDFFADFENDARFTRADWLAAQQNLRDLLLPADPDPTT